MASAALETAGRKLLAQQLNVVLPKLKGGTFIEHPVAHEESGLPVRSTLQGGCTIIRSRGKAQSGKSRHALHQLAHIEGGSDPAHSILPVSL